MSRGGIESPCSVQHAPDTERGTRVTEAGGCAESEFLIVSPPIIRDKSRMR
jgi:hypothetical protein